MLKRIKVAIAGICAVIALAVSAEDGSKPPVDLNKPVTNPTLTAALSKLAGNRTPENAASVRRELQKAIFLIPMLADELHTTPVTAEGKSIVLENSKLKIFMLTGKDGKSYLPLFTDWEEIQKWSNRSVNTLVMPASDAWSFAIANPKYEGIVVNPGGISLPLSRNAVQQLNQTK
ncbi:MAG: SseB family protein [Chromatiales bacterium]|nr:SseB family protein [Chromatiales bacterium]